MQHRRERRRDRDYDSEKKKHKICIMTDMEQVFGSLHQKPRGAHQEVLFKTRLNSGKKHRQVRDKSRVKMVMIDGVNMTTTESMDGANHHDVIDTGLKD